MTKEIRLCNELIAKRLEFMFALYRESAKPFPLDTDA